MERTISAFQQQHCCIFKKEHMAWRLRQGQYLVTLKVVDNNYYIIFVFCFEQMLL